MTVALRVPDAALPPIMRLLQRSVFNSDASWSRQRRILGALGRANRAHRGTIVSRIRPGGVPSDRLRAPGAWHDRLVIHFHGGGYTVGSPSLCRAWASALSAETLATVVLPDYRLGPEAPAPAAVDDGRAVWEELTRDVPAAAIVLSGDSAGAGIALCLAQALQAEGLAAPAGLILVSPWLDLTVDRSDLGDLARRDAVLTPSWLERCAVAYAGANDAASPTISPLLGDLSPLPPVLVQASTSDLLLGDADRFVTQARAEQTEVIYSRAPGLWHNYPMQAGIVSAADRAVAQAAAFVKGVCPLPSPRTTTYPAM